MRLDGPLALASGKRDGAPNPGKNHALSWFMIAVKTSKFSPRRVNKHHSAGSAMRVLMCKDPTGLFDTLLRFSSPSSCPLYPCTSMPLWPFWTLGTDPRTLRITQRSLLTNTTIWPPDLFPHEPPFQSLSLLLYSKLMCYCSGSNDIYQTNSSPQQPKLLGLATNWE